MSEKTVEIKFVGDLTRVVVHPGDRYVLKTENYLSLSNKVAIEQAWNAFFDYKEVPPLLILEPGMSLGVFGSEDNT